MDKLRGGGGGGKFCPAMNFQYINKEGLTSPKERRAGNFSQKVPASKTSRKEGIKSENMT